MNKTVNINLAGIFFHIDEDAYIKLQRYLESIKRSFTDSQGRSEIIADIEARIAELFSERIQFDKQVIGNKEVEQVITIMGQPEDYLVDDEIFEDSPKRETFRRTSQPSKKLYRDKDNSYIAGVSSGLGHYLGIDAVWVRLLWVLLTIGSGGTFILVYILFWVLVPEAVTTSEKLTMTGEPVNISNIEKKIRDGFENVSSTVSEKVRNVDFEKHGSKIKSTSKSFFDTLGDVIMFFFKAFAKFVGLILILSAAVALFALVISVVSLGSISNMHPMWMDYVNAVNTVGLPIWLGALILFFLIGIPLFFILYLGLKILINNLKSIGRVAKFSLLGLWLLALFSLIFIGINQASYYTLDNSVTERKELPITSQDTLYIKMNSGNFENSRYNQWRTNGFKISFNDKNQKVIFSRNVSLSVQSTKDSVAVLEIYKESQGRDFIEAKNSAEKISYSYSIKNGELVLDNFLETDFKNKFLDQKVLLNLYVPEGTVIKLNDNTKSFLNSRSSSENIISYDNAGHLMKISEDNASCLDCSAEDFLESEDGDDFNEIEGIDIEEERVESEADSTSTIVIDSSNRSKSDNVRLSVDEDGGKLVSDDN
ncbi:phage shock protein C (PspC) family protein [Flavobacteriaceae bacterium MAR_2010_188]|nr:phage shock protein C (PspC) family protein [Flavobacteriaceae bacterium MAR_2010_188]